MMYKENKLVKIFKDRMKHSKTPKKMLIQKKKKKR